MEVMKEVLRAISTSGKKPEVEEYGYQIYRLPLAYEGAYVGRDLLALSWEGKIKKEVKIRPIRVVSSRYVLVPHSRLEKEMRDAGAKVKILRTGTQFETRCWRKGDITTLLTLRNSYRVGAFRVDILLQEEGLYVPVFADFIRVPHIATQGRFLTPEAISEAFSFAKVIASELPRLKSITPSLGLLEFVKELRVVKREYDKGVLVKEETDEVGKKIYARLKREKTLYGFLLCLLKEVNALPEGYLYRRLRERVERYMGVVVRETLSLQAKLEAIRKAKKTA